MAFIKNGSLFDSNKCRALYKISGYCLGVVRSILKSLFPIVLLNV
ncbi:uncharacterized protein METZ01_LOCUS49629 [marine metagenome]|uniref:Uncharacterized protein n=1 Tax=marine metagenome TaxID=408172 RepID=A0A381RY48_9ZZZZ